MRLILSTILLSLFAISSSAQTSSAASAVAQSGDGGQPAQQSSGTGTLTGTVTDSSGAVVVGASVTVRDASGASFVTITDDTGRFRFRGLREGTQEVTVTQPSFEVEKNAVVAVVAGETVDLTIVLRPSGEQSSVTVVASQVEQIETSNGVVSNTLNENEVKSFPTNGRNFLSFISLAAGVSNQTGQDEIKVGVVGSAKFAVNGGRTEYNSFLVDGSDVLNTDIAASHGQSTLMVYPSIDAIKELKVLTSNYGAEYGRSASGTTLVTLRSGEQRQHGSAYEFLRNEFFNSRNYFDYGNKAPLYRRNDFGGSFGGPFFIPRVFNTGKDKSFFFISEEFRKERSPLQFNQGVPSDAERGYNVLTGGYGTVADFSAVCPSVYSTSNAADISKYPDCPTYQSVTFPLNQVPISATAQAFLQTGMIPRANATTGCISSTGSCYDATVSPATDYRQDLLRLDQILPFKSNLTLSVVHDHWQTVTAIPQWSNYINSFPSVQNSFQGPGLSAIAHLTTQIGREGLNDFSLGYTLQRIELASLAGPGVSLSRAGIDSTGLGTIFYDNTGKIPSLVFGGSNQEYGGAGFNIDTSFDPWSHELGTKSIRDSVTEMWKRHTLLAGIQFVHAARTEIDAANSANTGDEQGTILFSNQSGGSSRNAFADFLVGNGPSSPGPIEAYEQDNAQISYDMSYWTVEPYVQDDWKATSSLTLNLGLRLSMFYNWEPEGRNLYNWQLSSFNSTLLSSQGLDVNLTNGYLEASPSTSTGYGTPVPFTSTTETTNIQNGLIQCGVAGVAASCQSTHLLNPAPRVGFAWDPSHRGDYSIRGGYGVFFEHGTGSEANGGSLMGNAPYVLSVRESYPTTYASIGKPAAITGTTATPAFPLDAVSIPAKTIWPYIQQWSFGVEGKLPRDTFASVSYVGSKGTHLAVESQINQLHPVINANNPYSAGQPIQQEDCNAISTSATFVIPSDGLSIDKSQNPAAYSALYAACNGTPDTYDGATRVHQGLYYDPNSLRPLQGAGRVHSLQNVAGSIYHSMQINMRHNQGPLDLTMTYTYSHSIDSASDRYESTFVDAYDLAANRASSAFDQRHMLNLSYVYRLPLLTWVRGFHDAVTCSDEMDESDANCPLDKRSSYGGPSNLANILFSDWSLSGITLFQTGTPFSVVSNGSVTNGVSRPDNAGLLIGDSADSYPDRATTGGCLRLPRQEPISGTFGPLLENPCEFQAPRGLTQGNAGRNSMNNPGRTNLDVAMLRTFKTWKETDIQFRAEAFNVLNHTQFVIYDPNKGNTSSNTVSCYGDVTTGYSAGAGSCESANGFLRPIEAHRPRTMQFGLKLEF
jgi:hypothetical protein